jgi:thioredoxin reductase (NADPH)
METNMPGVFVAGDIAAAEGTVKLNLIAVGFAQAAVAVNVAKNYIDPKARIFPGHSTEMKV